MSRISTVASVGVLLCVVLSFFNSHWLQWELKGAQQVMAGTSRNLNAQITLSILILTLRKSNPVLGVIAGIFSLYLPISRAVLKMGSCAFSSLTSQFGDLMENKCLESFCNFFFLLNWLQSDSMYDHKLNRLDLNIRWRMEKVETSGSILPLGVFQYILKLHPVTEVKERSHKILMIYFLNCRWEDYLSACWCSDSFVRWLPRH